MNDKGGQIEFILAVTKGIVRDQRIRRTVLFFVVLAAMLMVFAGAVLFDGWLLAKPLLFLAYWGVCIWLTLLSILMALYDMLMVRMAERQERQRLKAEILAAKERKDAAE